MSDRSVGALVGGAVGFAVAGPIGLSIGSSVGAQVFAEDLPDIHGPRLQNGQVHAAEYGAPIPKVYGTKRVTGKVVWSSGIQEHATVTERDGKGGPSQTSTSYNYTASFAVQLCDGPIQAVSKVWANKEVLSNKREADINTTGMTLKQKLVHIITELVWAQVDLFTVYLGTETESVDPIMQAFEGVGNVPAYRGTPIIVFRDMPLGEYGNRLPVIEAEVVTATPDRWVEGIGDQIDTPTPSTTWHTNPCFGNPLDFYVLAHLGALDIRIYRCVGGTNIEVKKPTISAYYDMGRSKSADRPCWIVRNAAIIGEYIFYEYHPDEPEETNFKQYTLHVGEQLGLGQVLSYKTGDYLYVTTQFTTSSGKIYRFDLGNATVGGDVFPTDVSPTAWNTAENPVAIYYDGGFVYIIQQGLGKVWRYDSRLGSETLITTIPYSFTDESADMHVSGDDITVWSFSKIYGYYDGVWSEVVDTLAETDVTQFATGNDSQFHAHDRESFSFFNANLSTKWRAHSTLAKAYDTNGVTVGSIISDVCTSADLSGGDIDVTAMTTVVRGFERDRPMQARAVIESLRRAYIFDGPEVDHKLEFFEKKTSADVVITEDDMVTLPVPTRELDHRLPQQVNVRYLSHPDDHHTAHQYERRIAATDARGVADVTLPIVFDNDDDPKQIAKKIMYMAWVERDKYTGMVLPRRFAYLDAGDVVQATINSRTHLIRISALTERADGAIVIDGEAANPAVFDQYGTGGSAPVVPAALSFSGPTHLELLDIPLLRGANDGAGFYWAMCGYLDGWGAGTVFRSADAGITYSEVDSSSVEATIGKTTTALADGPAWVWDRANTLTVESISGTPSSVSEDLVHYGSNAFLVGDELIHAATVTDNGDGTYTLSDLLRGRNGTEWATSGHAVDERVVLLTSDTIKHLDDEAGQLNTAMIYKPVTAGETLQQTAGQSFTNTGNGLKPYSVVQLAGTRDGSNNLTCTWLRRSRRQPQAFWVPTVAEDSESYELEFWNVGETVQYGGTKTATSETFSYTAAQQTSDGATPGQTFVVKAYQISATVGRGTETKVTI